MKQTKSLPPHLSKSHFLNQVDALRVVSVLEHAIERLDLIGVISSDILDSSAEAHAHTDAGKQQLKEENQKQSVGHILEAQRELVKRYEELLLQRSDKARSKYSTAEEIQAQKDELHKLQQQIKENTKTLSRNLRDTPNEGNNWNKIQSERVTLMSAFDRCIRELQSGLGKSQKGALGKRTSQHRFKLHSDSQLQSAAADRIRGDGDSSEQMEADCSYGLFMVEVFNEYLQDRFLEEITEQERKVTELVNKLRMQLDEERQLMEQEIAERSIRQATLNNELRKLKVLTAEEAMKNELAKDAEFQTRRRVELQFMRELQDESKSRKERLAMENEAHNTMSDWLERKRDQLREQQLHWEKKSYEEINDLTQTLNALTARRDNVSRTLRERRDEYEEELKQKQDREERERMRVEAEAEAEVTLQRTMVSRIMQAYKSYKARTLLEQLVKEKGSKKKKKSKSDKK